MKKAAFIASVILVLTALLYVATGKLLSCEKPIKSRYVLLEGWISHTVLENASNYIVDNNIDSVFIVGMKNSISSIEIPVINKNRKLKKHGNNEYVIYWSGILGFEIPTEKLQESFTLNVKMHGKGYAKLFPHYRVFFNQQLISTGFVNEKDSVYKFNISTNATDSVSCIQFNYDNNISDRTLYISGIYIDTMDIDSLMLDNFFNSYAEMQAIHYVPKINDIKYYLGDRGFDTSKVKFIEVTEESFSKTLALAKGAEKYFSKNGIKNINIITANKHSSRSYLNFRKCLEKNTEVGCIPVATFVDNETSIPAGLDERISLLISWIYWWFH